MDITGRANSPLFTYYSNITWLFKSRGKKRIYLDKLKQKIFIMEKINYRGYIKRRTILSISAYQIYSELKTACSNQAPK